MNLQQKLTVMNIQRLLKKLDKGILENKQLLTPQAAYKLKTSQSIGTLNSALDQNQRSFVINEAITPHQKKTMIEMLSEKSKLDDQLSQIDIMKHMYESRQIRNKLRTKSIQKHSNQPTSGQKSLEKHLLKPSNTPSFNKAQKLQKAEEQIDSACKKLYTEQMLENSSYSQNYSSKNFNHQKVGAKRITYQYPDSSLHVQDENQQQPYEESPYYNEESISQIANISHNEDSYMPKKSLQSASSLDSKKAQNSLTHNQNNLEVSNHACKCNCLTRDQVQVLLNEFNQKLNKLSIRVQQLEYQNQNIKNKQKQAKELYQNQQIQKQAIAFELKKQTEEKEQLQTLLKDVLYKRERQKMQNSKQNTYRQNQKSQKKDKKLTNFSLAQNQSTAELKFRQSAGRQSESKMKVQNLLNKLQIKVDRV